MTDKVLDARDLLCPMPVLKARKALKEMAPGQVLEVHATDPASPLDIEVFCHSAGHTLLSSDTLDGVFVFRVERSA